MVKINRKNLSLYAIFTIFLALNIGLWLHTHTMRPVWGNVPPAPTTHGSSMMALGDAQMAYRVNAMMLQNLGDTGGDTTPLKDYNYNLLKGWFDVEDSLDPVANVVPSLAAFYFGATQNPKDQLDPVIDYLTVQGKRPEANKWRWLAQAVYLARYKKQDLQQALDLANTLATLDRTDLPLWAKTMPAFVLRAKGDRQASYAIMMGILSSGIHTLNPYEIRYLRDNICNQTLTPDEASRNSLCTSSQ